MLSPVLLLKPLKPPVFKTLLWLKIPERIEYKLISINDFFNITHLKQTSFLPALLLPSAVHGPTTSFNPFLYQSNPAPPIDTKSSLLWALYKSRVHDNEW